MGYSVPTPIQQQAIPLVLNGNDIVATAQTGTGKTAAFVVPILQKLAASPNKGLQCLILSPTRELAQQIDEQIFAIGYYSDIPSVTIYGGGDWGEQQKALERGVRIIVATPGRLLDLIKVRNIDFSALEILVLDEADRMLDMGFIPDVRTIVNRLPKKRQTLFFSATMSERLNPLLAEFLIDPSFITLSTNKAARGVNQWYYNVEHHAKPKLIAFLSKDERFNSIIVFCSTKRGADELSRELGRFKLPVASIHGDRSQQEREEALSAFKRGDIRILVATDVIARGIDIVEVSLVINYDVPRELEDYIHRIGRTARADSKGDAITFVSHHERRFLEPILKSMGEQLILLDLPVELKERSRDLEETEPTVAKQPEDLTSPPKRKSRNKPRYRKKPESTVSEPKRFEEVFDKEVSREKHAPPIPAQRNRPQLPPTEQAEVSDGVEHASVSRRRRRNRGGRNRRRTSDKPMEANRDVSEASQQRQKPKPNEHRRPGSAHQDQRRYKGPDTGSQRNKPRDTQTKDLSAMSTKLKSPNNGKRQEAPSDKGLLGFFKKLFKP